MKNSGLAEEFREEGISEGTRRAVRRFLERRFGPLSEDMLAALAVADEQKLDELVDYVGADTLEQIRARLGLR